MQVTIVGAGAIGGTIGAFLTEAGHDVTLVDVVPEHIEMMNRDGLRITGIRGDRQYPVRAMHADEITGPLQNVFLAVKGHLTAGALDSIEPLLADDGYVVSLQNGLNEEMIAARVGRHRTVGAFVHFGADYLEPGVIQLGQAQDIFIGELDGENSPRVNAIRDTLDAVMPAHVTNNIWGYLWGKLVYGSMAFAVSTVDAPVPEILDQPTGRQVARAASIETAVIAQKIGFKLESIGTFDPNLFLPNPDQETRADQSLNALRDEMRASIKQHMGIWRDLKVRKRPTEVDVQCGKVVHYAGEAGLAAPINKAIVDITHEIETGKRGMTWDNLDEIVRRADA